MKRSLPSWLKSLILLAIIAVLALAWVVYFDNKALAAHLPKWNWLQSSVGKLGQHVPVVVEADEDPDNTLNNIPVKVTKIMTATLHRYIEGFGTITPRQAQKGEIAASVNIAAPTSGVLAAMNCRLGQVVAAGDVLMQLDDRVAKAAEDQAEATLKQAQASLAALKATPRPDQLQIAQLAVDKSQSAVDFAQKNFDRLKSLAANEGTSAKSVEQGNLDLAAARNDLSVAQRQLALLKASPTPEDLAQENAKVAQAAAALASARVQRQLLTIVAPIEGTVVALNVNAGESVDPTKTLVQLIDMDRLMVDVDVPADQLPEKAEGLTADIVPTTAALKDASSTVSGTVSYVSPQVDPKNGTVMLGIDLPKGTALRPGLTVRVRIVAEEHKDVLAVPREAVVANENGDSVIALVEVVKDAKTGEDVQQAAHKSVKAGIEENGLIEISASDLKEGQTVVTAGAFGLPQATRIKIVE